MKVRIVLLIHNLLAECGVDNVAAVWFFGREMSTCLIDIGILKRGKTRSKWNRNGIPLDRKWNDCKPRMAFLRSVLMTASTAIHSMASTTMRRIYLLRRASSAADDDYKAARITFWRWSFDITTRSAVQLSIREYPFQRNANKPLHEREFLFATKKNSQATVWSWNLI